MAIDIDRVRLLSIRFRDAIEKCDRTVLPLSFVDFPRGSCGDAAPLLGTYLKENGLGQFNYVLGMRGDGERQHSHAWLRGGGVIVDITADQFPEILERVLVLRFSTWHDTFRQEVLNEGDYRVYDSYTKSVLGNAYRAILSVASD